MSLKYTSFTVRFFSVLIFLIMLVSPQSVTPVHAEGVCYVKEGAAGEGNGSSWGNAYPNLQSALGNLSCTEIWVAAGTYKPTGGTDRAISFTLKNGVAIYGGFAGTESSLDNRDWESNPTILSGDIEGDDTNIDGNHIAETPANIMGGNSYHVVSGVNLTASAILDGFIITAGATRPSFPNDSGGGMHLNESSPTLTNITFSGNSAIAGGGMFLFTSSPALTNVTFSGNTASVGGGVYLTNSSSPTLINVTFSGNTASDSGGGMSLNGGSPTLTGVTFSGNTASGNGGGMFLNNSSPSLTNITFSDNTALGGGGMYLLESSPILTNVTFSGNNASDSGGGMSLTAYSSPTLTGVTFSDNSAPIGGGMFLTASSPTLTDITFSANTASSYGGGMALYNSSSPNLTNVTFSGNNASDYGGGMVLSSSSPTLKGVTFNGNNALGGGGVYLTNSSPKLTNVTFSGNSASGGGGVYLESSSSPTLTNVTFSANNASLLGGGMFLDNSSPSLRNSILWGNTAPNNPSIGQMDESEAAIFDSLVQGVDNATDPLFVRNPSPGVDGIWNGVNDDYGDLHLQFGSPAIDQGNKNVINPILPATDLDGRQRVWNNAVDLGAYENHAIMYVKEGATGAGDGSSWSDAFPELRDALAASRPGDEIWVAAGSYMPTGDADRAISFTLKNDIAIYGGFVGDETERGDRNPEENSTILSGDIGTDNSYHVVSGVNLTASAVLDGFTITAGNANGASPDNNGAGMVLDNSSPTLTNISFSGNSADSGGGGMFLNNSSPSLTNITFSGNTAFGGGGMYLDTSSPTLTNVTFSANTASTSGGGMVLFSSSPTLANVSFSYNQATHYGGAIYNNSSNPGLTNITINNNSLTGTHAYGGGIYNENSSPTLTYVTFSENLVSGSTASGGGGMINWNSSHPILTNVTFTGNQATGTEAYGGGLLNDEGSNPTLTNVTFSNNSATSGGGGMTNNDGSSPTLTNVTFSDNNASLGGGMINGYNSPNPTLRNTIFWGNTADSGTTSQEQIYTITGTPDVSDSVIEGGYSGGVNIITTNPNLGTLGNYGGVTQTIPLLPGSSAIDAGDGDTCPLTDQRGNSRVGGCDIGAFESQGFTLSSPTGTNQSAVINTDFATPLGLSVTANAAGEPVNGGVVTFTSSLSNAWRTNPATFTAEIAGGVVSAPAAANGFAGGPYQVTASATGVASGVNFNLTNNKATPVITWNDPADIVYGTPLSVTQLNAEADVAGTFTYTPASGTILDVGDDQNLHVEFTPGQPDNNNSVSFDVEINVSARELEITGIAANNKVYDGAVSGNGYSGGTLVGIIGTNDVSLDGASAVLTFDDPNVGNGIGVTASGFGLEGEDAGNYTLAQPVGLTAEITAMPVTITPDAGQSKVFGAADPVFTYTHTELIGSDVITGALGREAGDLPGNYIYTLGTLTAGLNYSLSLAEEAFNITAVTEAATTTTLTATANPDNFGDSWMLTATVASDSGTPSGSVTFKLGTQTLGTVPLLNGVANFNTGRLPGGVYSFTAEFDGSDDYTASVSNALNLNAKYYLIFSLIFR